jgi:hypothetical protein
MVSSPATLFTVFKHHNEQPYEPTVVRVMTSIRTQCLPLFSLIQFIAWLIPWSWVRDSSACRQVLGGTPTYIETTTLDNQTDESLLVTNNDVKYLTQEEAEQIIARFKEIPQTHDRLVF